MATSTIHTGRRRFWSTICRRRTCTTSQTSSRKGLHGDNRMGWQALHWHHTRLGLQATKSASIYARVRNKSTQTIPTRETKSMTRSTISIRTDNIWCQKTICNRIIESTIAECKREKIHPKSLWKILVLWPSSRFNIALPHQRNCISVGEPYDGNYETNNTIVRLFSVTRGSNHHVQRQRHDISSTQRRQLFK